MTAKEYLWQIEGWQREIEEIDAAWMGETERLGLKLEALYTQASGVKAITYDKDRVQVSPQNSLQEIVILIEDTSREYSEAITIQRHEAKKKIDELQKKIDAIVEQINALSDTRYVSVLKQRYVYGKRWEEIAVCMRYGFRHVLRLHGQALSAFTAKYKDVI